jgi:hypothetical protein
MSFTTERYMYQPGNFFQFLTYNYIFYLFGEVFRCQIRNYSFGIQNTGVLPINCLLLLRVSTFTKIFELFS